MKVIFLVSLQWFLLTSLSAKEVESAEAIVPRPNLKSLSKSTYAENKATFFPFMMTQTAMLSGNSAEKLTSKIRNHLMKEVLPFKGHFTGNSIATKNFSSEMLKIPEHAVSGKALKAIEECNRDKCLVKLHKTSEKYVLERKKPEKRIKIYHDLMTDRLRKYLKDRQLVGYGQRWNNIDYFQRSVELLRFLKEDYPKSYKYISDRFWKKKPQIPELKQSFITQTKLSIKHKMGGPVWRIVEVFEFVEGEKTVFVEIHIYGNNLFDSSLTAYEVIPKGKRSVLVMTDVMEWDELKKSGFIRILYTDKIQKSVAQYQQLELKKFK